MKQLFSTLASAILHGILRIFPKTVPVALGVILSVLSVVSCSAPRTVPLNTVHQTTKVDTVYTNKMYFDSTYVSHQVFADRLHDTVFIRECNTEVRFRIMKDTVERVKLQLVHDSIPYPVVVESPNKAMPKASIFSKVYRVFLFVFLGFLVTFILIKCLKFITF